VTGYDEASGLTSGGRPTPTGTSTSSEIASDGLDVGEDGREGLHPTHPV